MTTTAERMRRHRERKAQGRIVLKIEVDSFAVSETLVESKLLHAWDADNPQKVARAVERLLGIVSLSTD